MPTQDLFLEYDAPALQPKTQLGAAFIKLGFKLVFEVMDLLDQSSHCAGQGLYVSW